MSERENHVAPEAPEMIVAAVVSPDPVWARLLALNLSARGIAASDHPGPDIGAALDSLPTGGWLVFDMDGRPGDELAGWEAVIAGMADADVSAAIVVDDLRRPLDRSDVRAEIVIKRSPDMRVMARKLIAAFTASPLERELASLQPSW